MVAEIKGAEIFLESSDEFFKKVSKFIDDYEVDSEKLSELRDICEIVKITAMTIKTLKEEPKGKQSPMEKIKKRHSTGEQVVA